MENGLTVLMFLGIALYFPNESGKREMGVGGRNE